jgi:hypothetical protein
VHVPKKIAALTSAALMALALGACASEQPTTSTDGDDAAQADVAPASNLTELVTQMESVEVASSGHMEITYSGELAETSGLAGSTTTADVEYGGSLEESTLHMSMAMMGIDVDMILVDGTMYLGMGELSENKYFSMSLEEMAKDPNMSPLFEQLDSIDPVAQADAMADAVTSFEHTGTEQVGGVEADVYTMTVDSTKIDAVAAGIEESMVDQVGEMTVVYRIGPDGLLLESDATMEVDGQELVTESTFSGWGEPIDVQAPPEADVVPYSEVAGQG